MAIMLNPRLNLIVLLSVALSSTTAHNTLRSTPKTPLQNALAVDIKDVLPPTVENTADTADVLGDLSQLTRGSTASPATLDQMQKDLATHQANHQSSVKMLENHQLELQKMKAVLNNASKVLSFHLQKAQEDERNSASSGIEARLHKAMQDQVTALVEQKMNALTTKMEARMDDILNAAAKRLGETVTDIARKSIQVEVDSVIDKYMEPPYTKGMVALVEKEVSSELDIRLEGVVMKEVNNVTAGVVNGLQWKEPQELENGVHVIDVDDQKDNRGDGVNEDLNPTGWGLGVANASRFKRASTTTSPVAERQDGYLVQPQIDPISGAPLFSYDAKNDLLGPEHWGEITPLYRTCNTGRHQSPIDIRSEDHTAVASVAGGNNNNQIVNVRYDEYLSDVTFNYNEVLSPLILQNKGHVVEIPVHGDAPSDEGEPVVPKEDGRKYVLSYGTS